MATNDSDTSQGHQQKAVLKRKLTGPPRLLLGKAKAMNQTGGRSDARVQRHQRRMDTNGTSKDSTPPPAHPDTLGEEGSPSATVCPPGSPTAVAAKEAEHSHQTRLDNDGSACDTGSEDAKVKDQHLDGGSRKKKRKAKEGLGLRRLLPHVFMCVRWRQKNHSHPEAQKDDAVASQTVECSGEDSQSTGDTITQGNAEQGAVCHPDGDATIQPGEGAEAGKKRTRHVWFPFAGRHKSKGRRQSKQSQSLEEKSEERKTTLRKRIQSFLTRGKKSASSKTFECGEAHTPFPDQTERQVGSQDDESKDLPDTPEEGSSDREGERCCPETVTVSAEVTADTEKGAECECQDADNTDPTHKTSEDLSAKDEDELKQAEPSCMDIQAIDATEASSLSDSVANSACVAELSPVLSPQIDIALADDVFDNGAEDTKLFDDTESNTTEATGPEPSSHVAPHHHHHASNMSFLTVPVDGFWAPRESNSPDVKSCFNTFDCSLAPEDASLITGESLLILTANSLVQAAIERALCQLSRDVQQPPLTNSYTDAECTNMEGS